MVQYLIKIFHLALQGYIILKTQKALIVSNSWSGHFSLGPYLYWKALRDSEEVALFKHTAIKKQGGVETRKRAYKGVKNVVVCTY